MNPQKDEPNPGITLGLGGIFKGLGSLLELTSQLVQKAEKLKEEGEQAGTSGSVGVPGGLHAVYGFSVRVGSHGEPVFEKFGNVREKAGKGPAIDDVREPITDFLDEEDHFLVVAELPGMEASAVRWEIKDDVLIISGESGVRKYRKELVLPERVDEKKAAGSYKNGILELKLWKQSRT